MNGIFDSEDKVFTTANGVFNRSVSGPGWIECQVLQTVAQWQGMSWLNSFAALPSVVPVWTDLPLAGFAGGYPVPMAFRWAHRKRYLTNSLAWTLDYPHSLYPLSGNYSGSVTMSGAAKWPHFTGIKSGSVTGWPPAYSMPAASLSAPTDSVYGFAKPPELGGWGWAQVGLGLTFTTTASSWTDWACDSAIDYASEGVTLAQNMTAALSSEHTYDVPLNKLITAIRARTWSGASWYNRFAYGNGRIQDWNEYGNGRITTEAAADNALYTADGALFDFSWQPIFFANSSPINSADGGLTDQGAILGQLCSWWAYPTNEETSQDNEPMSPIVAQRARWKADKRYATTTDTNGTYNYWFGKGTIPRWYNPGITGELNPLAPVNISLLGVGIAAKNQIVEVPFPWNTDTLPTWTELTLNGNAVLSVGEVVFCVVGESLADWQTRTGLTVSV